MKRYTGVRTVCSNCGQDFARCDECRKLIKRSFYIHCVGGRHYCSRKCLELSGNIVQVRVPLLYLMRCLNCNHEEVRRYPWSDCEICGGRYRLVCVAIGQATDYQSFLLLGWRENGNHLSVYNWAWQKGYGPLVEKSESGKNEK